MYIPRGKLNFFKIFIFWSESTQATGPFHPLGCLLFCNAILLEWSLKKNAQKPSYVNSSLHKRHHIPITTAVKESRQKKLSMLQPIGKPMPHPHSQRFWGKPNLAQPHWANPVALDVSEQQRWCHLVGKLLLGPKLLPGPPSQSSRLLFPASDKLGMPPL